MKIRNIHIALGNIARTTNAKHLEALSTRTLYKPADNDTDEREITGYGIECAVRKGDTQVVKFPLEVKEKIDLLHKHLDDNRLVNISFVGLKLSLYELKTKSGDTITGVSAKADDFEMSVIDPDVDDLDIEL